MRIVNEKTFNEHTDAGNLVKAIATIYGSSSESKPTSNIANGSVFIETDTLAVYMFDEENETWRELA